MPMNPEATHATEQPDAEDGAVARAAGLGEAVYDRITGI